MKKWTLDAMSDVARLSSNEDWPEFHARYPDISYDSWETKRRRVLRAEQADESLADDELALSRDRLKHEQPHSRDGGHDLDIDAHLGARVHTPDNVNFRIGFFDYETTGLKANFGRTLVFSVCGADGKMTTLRADDPALQGRTRRDDAKLAAASRDILESYNILVSWNGKRFDIRYLNGRLLLGGERPLRSDIMHADLLPISRHYFAWHSHRLDAVAKTLRLTNQKTELDFDAIEAARDGEAWALDNIVEHCEADVRVLRDVFFRYQDIISIVHR
jgi:uncharacterized protein YprB with RNaseH-like and TPR domain